MRSFILIPFFLSALVAAKDDKDDKKWKIVADPEDTCKAKGFDLYTGGRGWGCTPYEKDMPGLKFEGDGYELVWYGKVDNKGSKDKPKYECSDKKDVDAGKCMTKDALKDVKGFEVGLPFLLDLYLTLGCRELTLISL